jgi:hypothetical protein
LRGGGEVLQGEEGGCECADGHGGGSS